MRPMVTKATDADLQATLEWLREEEAATGHSFYCNRGVIEQAQGQGHCFVARIDGRCVGLLVTEFDGSPCIVTTHPDYRRQGIGRRLIAYSVRRARRQGTGRIEADCVTEAGERLCRSMGFRFRSKGNAGWGQGRLYTLPKGTRLKRFAMNPAARFAAELDLEAERLGLVVVGWDRLAGV